MARKNISSSLRWTIFARDGFTCRYCGRQAGEDGVELAVDHVVSVADGGTNAADNLVTACRDCNGGKGARSLLAAPDSADAMRRMRERAEKALGLAEQIREAVDSRKDLEQEVINMKCDAYGVSTVNFPKGEMTTALKLIDEFGADRVTEWYRLAADRRVSQWQAIKYVCGIARKVRSESAGGES
jgi:hypothetical protein